MTSTHTTPHITASGIILTTLATACLGLPCSPARAADAIPAYEPASQLVKYADLNLNSPEGIARLYQRIEAAARDVCGSDAAARPLAEWSRARICAKASVSRAVAQIGHPALAALYTKKTGRLIDRRTLLSKR